MFHLRFKQGLMALWRFGGVLRSVYALPTARPQRRFLKYTLVRLPHGYAPLLAMIPRHMDASTLTTIAEEYGKGRDSYNASCVSNALQYMKQ